MSDNIPCRVTLDTRRHYAHERTDKEINMAEMRARERIRERVRAGFAKDSGHLSEEMAVHLTTCPAFEGAMIALADTLAATSKDDRLKARLALFDALRPWLDEALDLSVESVTDAILDREGPDACDFEPYQN